MHPGTITSPNREVELITLYHESLIKGAIRMSFEASLEWKGIWTMSPACQFNKLCSLSGWIHWVACKPRMSWPTARSGRCSLTWSPPMDHSMDCFTMHRTHSGYSHVPFQCSRIFWALNWLLLPTGVDGLMNVFDSERVCAWVIDNHVLISDVFLHYK